MIKKRLLIFALLLAAGCTSDPVSENADSAAVRPVSQKIVNTTVHADQRTLLVYFDNAAIVPLEKTTAEAAMTRSAATRAGIASVDEALTALNISSLRRVFPYFPKTEERARAAGLHKWYVVTFDADADLDAAASRLAEVAEVERIQFNTRLVKTSDCKVTPLHVAAMPSTRAAYQFNDPALTRQWHYINTGDKSNAPFARAGGDINVQDAWKITGGNPQVIVAIVDEGVKYSHPDLAANMWVNPSPGSQGDAYVNDLHGYNFVTHGSISWNHPSNKDGGDSGHGTHVAGTVAAVNNNNIGVAGVAGGTGKNDGVKLMSCQIFSGALDGSGGAPGSGASATAAEAIKYAADHGAAIIQCSWGFPAEYLQSDEAYIRHSRVEQEAIEYFIGTKNCAAIDGGIAIFSSGNDSKAMSGYPAAYRDYISVTSFSPDYQPAYYTNYGPGCNIAAPGGDAYLIESGASQVLSTLPSELYDDEYGYMQGTSMACPHVSGVAALGLSYALTKGKHFSLDEFKSMLLTSVNDMERYLDGTKESKFTMNLANYRKKMGTGSIDAYQLLMQIEGTPCLKANVGANQFIALTNYFGGSATSLTYVSVEMSQEDMTRLGVTEAPTIQYGKLQFKCAKPGTAKIRVTAIAGGDKLGTGTSMGGQSVTKEFVIIARGVKTANGGWL